MPKNSEPSDLDLSPAYQLWRANNAVQRATRRALEPLGLTQVQFLVLAAVDRLGHSDRTVSQARVCRWANLDENMVSQVARALEVRGLLSRLRCAQDKRAKILALTESGLVTVAAARSEVRAQNSRLFRSAGTEHLLPVLRELAESLEAAEK